LAGAVSVTTVIRDLSACVSLLPLPACGERVGVRGSIR
jgi:hypothetical protein